jgi:hypothetical protein
MRRRGRVERSSPLLRCDDEIARLTAKVWTSDARNAPLRADIRPCPKSRVPLY